MKFRMTGAWKRVGLAVAFCIAAGLFSPATQAAESKVISGISVSFKDNYGQEEILEPEITVSVTGAELSQVIWASDREKWRPGKKVRVSLVLTSTGKIFANQYSQSECKVRGARFVSAKAENNETLVVKADYLPVVILGKTDWCGWDSEEQTKAVWNKVEYATGYQLNLYADNKRKAKVTVSTNWADLSSHIDNEDATWYYEVQATGYSSEDKKYRKSGEYVTSADTYFEGLGDVGGTWKNGQYKSKDGDYTVNDWKLIQGKWYFFDGNGKKATGWLNRNGIWYYLYSDGSMATGWQSINNKWYYLNPDGSMAIGWRQMAPSIWYYFYEDGSMAADTWIGEYRLNGDGVWMQ